MDNSVLILNGQVVRTDGLIEADGKLKFLTKLWENPDPTSAFASQDVTLSSSDYDLLLTLFDITAPSGFIKSCITRKGDVIWLESVDADLNKHTYCRYTTAQTDTVLTFTGGYYDGVANNAKCVPVVIYGLKKEYDIDALARNAVAKEIYSTDETVVGTWIDGKPIYRKVIDIGALPNATTKSVDIGITNLHRIIKMDGYFYKLSGSRGISACFPYPNIRDASQDSEVNIYFDGTSMKVRTKNDMSSFTESYVILEYTKTTD